MTFQRPVNIGDLMKFRSWVMHTWPSPHNHGQVGGWAGAGLWREPALCVAQLLAWGSCERVSAFRG